MSEKPTLARGEVYRWTDTATQLECNVYRSTEIEEEDGNEAPYWTHVAVAPDHELYKSQYLPGGLVPFGVWDTKNPDSVLWWIYHPDYDGYTMQEAMEKAPYLAALIRDGDYNLNPPDGG